MQDTRSVTVSELIMCISTCIVRCHYRFYPGQRAKTPDNPVKYLSPGNSTLPSWSWHKESTFSFTSVSFALTIGDYEYGKQLHLLERCRCLQIAGLALSECKQRRNFHTNLTNLYLLIFVYICVYVCLYVCLCVLIYVCMCLSVHVHVCMCVYVCVSMFVCACARVKTGSRAFFLN